MTLKTVKNFYETFKIPTHQHSNNVLYACVQNGETNKKNTLINLVSIPTYMYNFIFVYFIHFKIFNTPQTY